jgi:hypothetical protein
MSSHVLPCAQQKTKDGQIWSLFASGGARRAIAPVERRKREIFTIKWYGLRKTFVVLLGAAVSFQLIPI